MTSITPDELRDRLETSTSTRIIDVRTPGEFETAHITGAHNVPLDVLRGHAPAVVARLADADVVLVCQSGPRATEAQRVLTEHGLASGWVLDRGHAGWEERGLPVRRGTAHWGLERQVRLVAGGVVLWSVVGSVAAPRLKWLAAAIGAGLTYAAVTDTCAFSTGSATRRNRGPA